MHDVGRIFFEFVGITTCNLKAAWDNSYGPEQDSIRVQGNETTSLGYQGGRAVMTFHRIGIAATVGRVFGATPPGVQSNVW